MVLLGACSQASWRNTVAHSLSVVARVAGTLVAASAFLQLYDNPAAGQHSHGAATGKLMFESSVSRTILQTTSARIAFQSRFLALATPSARQRPG